MATEIKRLNISSALMFSDGEGDKEINETDTDCELSLRDGGFLVRYSEGEGDARCAVRILYSRGVLTVKREGTVRSELKFKQGERLVGSYAVGAYGFDAEVYTKSLVVGESAEQIFVKLSYDMTLGGVERTCEMQIRLS